MPNQCREVFFLDVTSLSFCNNELPRSLESESELSLSRLDLLFFRFFSFFLCFFFFLSEDLSRYVFFFFLFRLSGDLSRHSASSLPLSTVKTVGTLAAGAVLPPGGRGGNLGPY